MIGIKGQENQGCNADTRAARTSDMGSMKIGLMLHSLVALSDDASYLNRARVQPTIVSPDQGLRQSSFHHGSRVSGSKWECTCFNSRDTLWRVQTVARKVLAY